VANRSGSPAKSRLARPVVETIRRRSLHKEVVEELGRKIVGGEFGETGMLPTEPQLAADLGVSRNVLREAIKVLAAKGLVAVRPKTGTRVRPESDWNLLDREVLTWQAFSSLKLPHSFNLTEFRLIVEPKAAFLAAKRATPEDIDQIDRACAELEACVGHVERVPEVDIIFHRSIHRASHNAILNNIGSLTASLMQIQVQLTTVEPGSFERGLPLHRELTEAIRRRDSEAAEDAARRLCEMPYLDLAGRIDPKGNRGILSTAGDATRPGRIPPG
jgi:GntR family transcriptional regulator, galactonate operon transcriptional repressor